MIGVTLKELKVKWNSKAILTPAEKFQVKLLKEAGAYTRMIQRNSIKRAANRKDRSQPGQPPKHHGTPLLGGDGYKGTIFYAARCSCKDRLPTGKRFLVLLNMAASSWS
jgi:hypothetical protein